MAKGDFSWMREGATSMLHVVDSVGAGGRQLSAFVAEIEFQDGGAFKVKGFKIGCSLIEPDATVLRATTRDEVEGAVITQAKGLVHLL